MEELDLQEKIVEYNGTKHNFLCKNYGVLFKKIIRKNAISQLIGYRYP